MLTKKKASKNQQLSLEKIGLFLKDVNKYSQESYLSLTEL
jgi:hypothetical protein